MKNPDLAKFIEETDKVLLRYNRIKSNQSNYRESAGEMSALHGPTDTALGQVVTGIKERRRLAQPLNNQIGKASGLSM